MANRELTNTATVTWDFSTPGQAKANIVGGGGGDLPSEDDVRDGVDYDNAAQTGNLVLPTAAQVETGVGFGSNGTEFTGTLSGGGGGAGAALLFEDGTQFTDENDEAIFVGLDPAKLSALGDALTTGAPDYYPIVQGGLVKKISRANLLNEVTLAFSDVTTNNVSTTMHGFVKKLPGNALLFYNGVGEWVLL